MKLEMYTKYEARELAVHASSVWAGMTYSRREIDVLEEWGQGCYELHFYCAEVAALLLEIDTKLYSALGGDVFPGMFAYGLDEELGRMLPDLNFPKSDKELKEHISKLVISFCESGGDTAVATAERVTQEWKDE